MAKEVELTYVYSKKYDDYCEYFTHNNKTCICSYENQPCDSNIIS